LYDSAIFGNGQLRGRQSIHHSLVGIFIDEQVVAHHSSLLDLFVE